MEQLDLFGFPVEPAKPAKKKEAPAKAKPAISQPRPPAPESIFAPAPAQEAVVQAAEEPVAAPVIETTEATAVIAVEPMEAPAIEIPAEEPAPAEVFAVEPGSVEPFVAPVDTAQPVETGIFTVEPVPVEQVTTPVVADLEEPEVSVKKTQPAKPKTAPASAVKPAGKRGRKSFREMDSEVDLVEVPDESVLQQKLYYPISEVAGWFKVNTSLLRFWENEFDILQPRKTRKGDRLFRVEDIKNLQLIYFLLRQRKFSIDGAKKYLKSNKKEADAQAQVIQSLNRFKSFLLELKTNLAS